MNENSLSVGFGQESITPAISVPLAGYGNTSTRFSESVRDMLYATCIAFTSGEDTVLLYTQDLVRSHRPWVLEARQMISAATGVREDRIMICATHTHSAPDSLSQEPAITEHYKEFYMNSLVRAAQKAMEDRAPAELYTSTGLTRGLNFIRHYVLEDGTYAGSNFGHPSQSPMVRHESAADPFFRLVKIARTGKQDILLMNWQAHPCRMPDGSRNKEISPDFIGPLRDIMQEKTGMLFAYFTGTAGNISGDSRMEAFKHGLIYEKYSQKLAEFALSAMPKLTKIGGCGIRTITEEFEQPVNHDDEHLAPQARQVVDLWMEKGRLPANELGKELGLTSVYHASAVLGRVSRPATAKLELNAVAIGELAFVTLPFESFSDHGVYIKQNSPFANTMVFSCANGGWSYIPTKRAYEFGCYESYVSYFAKGAGEAVAEEAVQLLKSIR